MVEVCFKKEARNWDRGTNWLSATETGTKKGRGEWQLGGKPSD